VEVDLE
jgi:hypothetical protein